jgi:hypothetical protein
MGRRGGDEAVARVELSRLSAVLGYVAEARDRLNTLIDDLVGAIVQVARFESPEVGKKAGEWGRLLGDAARLLLVARELVRSYWGQGETR